jgi:LEA14-like dessication related protein
MVGARWAAVGFVALALAGCPKGGLEGVGDALKAFLPKVRFKALKLRDIDFRHVDTDFVLAVDNPNPIQVGLASFGYQLDLAGQRFLTGNNDKGLKLEARGTSNVVLPLSVTFADVLQLAGALGRADDVPFAFSGKLGFATPLGEVKVPWNAKGAFPVLRVPRVRVAGVKLGKLDLLKQSATVEVQLGVAHEQASALTFDAFDYGLSFGGRQVVGGVVARLAEVPPGAEKTISLPVTVNLLQVGATVVDAISKKGKLPVGLEATVQVGTPFGAIPLRIDETGQVTVQ